MDEGLLKLLDQLDSLMNLREKSAASYAPAAEGRLLDLSINALKMAIQANMEARDKGMSGVPETYNDLRRSLAESPEHRSETVAMIRDSSHVHERYLRDRVQHLTGLSAFNKARSNVPEIVRGRGLAMGNSSSRALQVLRGRLAGPSNAGVAIDSTSKEESTSRQFQNDLGMDRD